MEALSMVVGALGAGALQAATSSANDAITTGYQRLKSLVSRKLGDDAKSAMVLAEHEKDPETWRAPLEAVIVEKGAHLDDEVRAAAIHVINLITSSSNDAVKQTGDHNIANVSTFHAPVTAEGSVFGTSIVVPPREPKTK
jgi:hypothetical protein